MHDINCSQAHPDLPEHCFDHIDAQGIGVRVDLVPSTLEGCLWSLESTWVCDGAPLAGRDLGDLGAMPAPEPVVDFVQVADPTLYNEAGAVICEVGVPVILILVMTIFIFASALIQLFKEK